MASLWGAVVPGHSDRRTSMPVVVLPRLGMSVVGSVVVSQRSETVDGGGGGLGG